MNKKPTYDELAAQLTYWKEQATLLSANVERLYEAYIGFCETDLESVLHVAFDETPTQSLNHITEQLGCSEQALNELKAQIAERQCPELAAQVEEETIMRCINKIHEWSGGIIVATQIKIMPRKYSNQPETAAREGE